MDKQSEPSRYCLKCFYCLDHLDSHECPECGRQFDPQQSDSFSPRPSPSAWPSWETWIALGMLTLLIYTTSDWIGVREVFGSRIRVHWLYPGASIVHRLEELCWASPLIGLIPVFFISGLRKRQYTRKAWLIAILGLLLFAVWPGTWVWFHDLPFILSEAHEWEGYWEAWRKNLDPGEWWGLW